MRRVAPTDAPCGGITGGDTCEGTPGKSGLLGNQPPQPGEGSHAPSAADFAQTSKDSGEPAAAAVHGGPLQQKGFFDAKSNAVFDGIDKAQVGGTPRNPRWQSFGDIDAQDIAPTDAPCGGKAGGGTCESTSGLLGNQPPSLGGSHAPRAADFVLTGKDLSEPAAAAAHGRPLQQNGSADSKIGRRKQRRGAKILAAREPISSPPDGLFMQETDQKAEELTEQDFQIEPGVCTKTACKFFVAGRCKRGHKCAFAHVEAGHGTLDGGAELLDVEKAQRGGADVAEGGLDTTVIYSGTLKKLSTTSGFGVVTPDVGRPDLFAQLSDSGGLADCRQGEAVTFLVEWDSWSGRYKCVAVIPA